MKSEFCGRSPRDEDREPIKRRGARTLNMTHDLEYDAALLTHRLEVYEDIVADTRRDLGRIAISLSGQLQFNFNTLQDDPRSIAVEGEW